MNHTYDGIAFFGKIDDHLLGYHGKFFYFVFLVGCVSELTSDVVECLGRVDGYLKSPVVEDLENGECGIHWLGGDWLTVVVRGPRRLPRNLPPAAWGSGDWRVWRVC